MTTIKDVSERAGVSQATVSRVINGTSAVSPDKKFKVEQAIQDLGYRPNSIAQALASSRTDSIGIVVPELGSPFFASLLQEIEDNLRRYGYHVVVTAGSNTQKGQQESVDFLLGRRVDALILHTLELSDDFLIDLDKRGIPVVLVNRFVPEMATSCIGIDNELGGIEATKHLLKNGHTRIACITGPLDKSDARGRLLGYRKAIELAGLKYDEMLVAQSGFTEKSGFKAMEKLLLRREQGHCNFSAVFASNDHMAVGAMECMKEHGLDIPQDISVVGFDNVNFSRYLSPALTTIHFPIEQTGVEAVNLTLAKLKQSVRNVNFTLSPTLVARNSVKDLEKKPYDFNKEII